MMEFEPMTDKKNVPPISPLFAMPAARPLVPDTRMLDSDPRIQKFLDYFRERYEREYGVPTPTGLWAHQLPLAEQKKLSAEEYEQRMAPWHRGLWRAIIMNALEKGRIDCLPDTMLASVARLAKPPQDIPRGPSPPKL